MHMLSNLTIDIVVSIYTRIEIVSAGLGRLSDIALAAVGRAWVEDNQCAIQRLPVTWPLTTTARELCMKTITTSPLEMQNLYIYIHQLTTKTILTVYVYTIPIMAHEDYFNWYIDIVVKLQRHHKQSCNFAVRCTISS